MSSSSPSSGRGGKRIGAGRKPGPNPGIRHAPRLPLAPGTPVLVTIPVKRDLPNLRRTAERKAIEGALRAGNDRFGFRVKHHSIQKDRLQLLVEAEDRAALTRGLQGLFIRVAKALNRCWSRKGSVFRDRYHDRILRTQREVREAREAFR